MGGGGSPSPPAPTPVAVPSAADEEAAEERARLYSLLRSRRGAIGLLYGPRRRSSMLAKPAPVAKASPLAPVYADPSGAGWGGDSGGAGGDSGSGSGGGGGAGGAGDGGMSDGGA